MIPTRRPARLVLGAAVVTMTVGRGGRNTWHGTGISVGFHPAQKAPARSTGPLLGVC
jgi:hypothetical protein